MKILFQLLIICLPWAIRRKLLILFFGYKIHPTARIGKSLIFPKKLEMEAHSRIHHLVICKQIDSLVLSEDSGIATMTYITGFKTAGNNFFKEVKNRRCELILGKSAGITSRHFVDCNGGAVKKYDSNGNSIDNVNFSLDDDESSGTRKYFALTGPILDVIENGYTLVIDELDSKLHPNLVCRIVSLFNSKELNTKNAQLIFNTHDTNLLSTGLFRRDQIWFTDKNKYGEAKLYSLADFKSDEVKKNEPFEENYIRGKYGAIPFLGFFENLNNLLTQNENEK